MDNHADTHCLGKNCRPISFTSEECSVAPFLSEYSEVTNVPIGTGATAYTLTSGEVIILLFGQGLWFGNRMERTLINPNQCRAYGVSICDDPVDPHRPLGIMCTGENGEDLFIQMFMNGSTCTFLSRYPTDIELDSCRRFLLSDEHVWDPSSDVFRHSSMEEEQLTISRVLSSRSIHMSKTGLELSADPFLHEFDKRMISICPSLFQDLAT